MEVQSPPSTSSIRIGGEEHATDIENEVPVSSPVYYCGLDLMVILFARTLFLSSVKKPWSQLRFPQSLKKKL